MVSQNSVNIYIEQLVSEKNISQVWETILNSKGFSSLFIEAPIEFKEGLQGELVWKKHLFFKVSGKYEVESYKENMNLLLKITANQFSSVFLLTTEENNEGILVRIDHRSFYGKNSQYFKKIFFRRWKGIQRLLLKMNKVN